MSWIAQIAENDLQLLSSLKQRSIADLESLVRKHNAAYWDRNKPEISDEAYDRLVEALRQRAPESSVLIELGETRPQGNEARRFETVTHSVPMLSLDKCYDDKTLYRWRDKVRGDLLAMPKIDGVACTIRYNKKGALFLAATRGDGRAGDNITQNVLEIDDIPNKLPLSLLEKSLGEDAEYLEVRGEVFMLLSRFNSVYAEDFANPRNLAAGALKQKDPQKTKEAGLSFFPYGGMGLTEKSELAKSKVLERMGFRAIPTLLTAKDRDAAEGYLYFSKQRYEFDYETDGVVIRADDVAEQSRLGQTAHHPRWAIAYKFQGEAAKTTLEEVVWSVGRTGVITPVAVVLPVQVSGATVTRASLHNLAILNNLELTKEASVEIVRRGGVIPHVERVFEHGKEPIVIPSKCPCCEGTTEVRGDFLYCVKADACTDVIRARVAYFCSVIDLQGLGEKHLLNLIEKSLISAPADLYALTTEKLEGIDRMGPKLAAKIISEIEQKRTLTPAVFLASLGLSDVGPTVAEQLCLSFGGFQPLFDVPEEEVQAVHGMGEAIARSLVTGLTNQRSEIEKLLEEVTLIEAKKAVFTGHLFFEKSVVFTGKMAQLDRKSAQREVQLKGGKTPSSVTKDLDFLVVGDDGSPLLGDGKVSTKHKKAAALNAKGSKIKVISETDFLKFLAQSDAQEAPFSDAEQMSLL